MSGWVACLSVVATLGVIVTTTVFALLIEALRDEWRRIEHDYWRWLQDDQREDG